MRSTHVTVMALALSIPAAGHSQDPQAAAPQVTALQNCRGKSDAAERLRCYDQSVDAFLAATTSRELVVIDKAAVKETRRGLFGFTLPKLAFLSGRPGDRADEAEANELQSTVKSSRRFGTGLWRFALESGGTWETIEDSRSFDNPRPGQTVSIERGTLGSYRARLGKGRSVQVRRVQ